MLKATKSLLCIYTHVKDLFNLKLSINVSWTDLLIDLRQGQMVS